MWGDYARADWKWKTRNKYQGYSNTPESGR